jgi:hypothetical protein
MDNKAGKTMNKSIFLLVILLLLVPVLLGACNSGTSPVPSITSPVIASKTYTNHAHNFSVQYPADWGLTENVTQTQEAQGILVIFMGNLSTQNSSIVIEADKWPSNSPLAQYAAAVEDQILKVQLQNYVKLSEGPATISGMPAIIRIFTASLKGIPRKYAQLYFKRGDFAYAISYSNNLDAFDTFYSSFELAVSTFKFN